MQKRHSNKELYFQEQVFTTKEYVIPFIEQHFPLKESTRILEVGCGEGGNLLPFLDRGYHATGVDLSEGKIDLAKKFLSIHFQNELVSLVADDIYHLDPGETGLFDLVMLRDVIEHIHDQAKFMQFIKCFLKQDGLIFIGFPPWYNPFGGHQQICRHRILNKLPYYHLLPKPVYRLMLKAGGEPSDRIQGLLEIKETGISIERFEKIISKTDYKIHMKKLYFINPNYEVKFKLKPREQLKIMTGIPFFRNFVTTACYYLVKKK